MDIHDYRLASETRDILDTIPQIVSLHGKSGLVDYINPRWHEYTGSSAGGGLGRASRTFVHPDDLAVLEPLARCDGTPRSHEPAKFEIRIRRYDGVYRRFLMESRQLPAPDGSETRWLQTSTDIDDVKRAQAALVESEAQYRTLTEVMPQLLWTVDAQDRFEFVNRR